MNKELKLTIEQTFNEISKFQFILTEGRKGNHLLFEPDTIRLAFRKDQGDLADLFEKEIERINEVLNHIFSLSTFEEKRSYLRTLPRDLQYAMVFGYFQLLDGQIEGESNEQTIH